MEKIDQVLEIVAKAFVNPKIDKISTSMLIHTILTNALVQYKIKAQFKNPKHLHKTTFVQNLVTSIAILPIKIVYVNVTLIVNYSLS